MIWLPLCWPLVWPQRLLALVRLLRSKKSQRFDYLWPSGSINKTIKRFYVFFFFFFFFLHRVNVAWNEFTVPSRRSEGQKWSGQPFESWRNFDRWPPRGQILGRPLYIMRLFPTKMLYFNAPFFPIKCSIPSRKSLKMPPIMLIIQRLFSLIVAF